MPPFPQMLRTEEEVMVVRRNVLATFAVATLVMVGAAGFASTRAGGTSQDQCALPLSARTGGWVCPAETRTP